MEGISYFYVLLAGLLSFLSPCVLPIVPGYLCFIAGTSLDKALDSQEVLRINILKYATSFVLGFSTVFVIMGASATYLSGLLYEYFDYLRIIETYCHHYNIPHFRVIVNPLITCICPISYDSSNYCKTRVIPIYFFLTIHLPNAM